ncbi:MAG: T9SS type A sorting domain-containing protein [Candidatus Celaenobacter antarcticus]|nr:T9SS type A sorting domain-containing protein [Candidatus Celaenobacter antarcticus]
MKIKLILVSLLMIGISSFLFGEDRGCTQKDVQPEGGFTCVGEATIYEPPAMSENELVEISRDGTWTLIDSLELSHYVEAGQGYNVYYDDETESLKQYAVYTQYDLTDESEQAIAKSPKWVRNDLYMVLSHVSELYQNEWASAINNAEDPYIDEIAFSVAHLSPQYLSANSAGDLYGSAEMLEENAELIYSNAQYLDYVEVVDYGTSATDENYYSTTRYKKVDARGDTVEVEVPKDIYYWYIVDPKITDEIPAYINPSIVESNSTHTNNFADPPIGVFWRDYLFNQADTGYPILRDSLAGCNIVWDGTQNVNATMTHAAAIITRWINETMEFTSNSERPHQPARIYKKHIGRCGEHADITAATARAALIPCTSILAISGDHTWNEFWEEGWVHWEPVNNSLNNPLVYENGWGWSFGSVFEMRSDGWLSSVTDTYSDGSATITIYVLDNHGNPIDGGEVLLAVASGASIYLDNYGITDNEGKYTFVVGEGKHYFARVDTDIGSYPASSNQVTSLMDNAVNGQDYSYNLNVSGTMPSLNYVSTDVPEDTEDDYRLEVFFTVPTQIVTGVSLFDDLDNAGMHKYEDDGSIDHVMIAGSDLIWYLINEQFNAFNVYAGADQGNAIFNIPVGNDWYSCFSNMLHLNNYQYVEGMARLYYYNTAVDEPSSDESAEILLTNSPNPFRESTTISFAGTTNVLEPSQIDIYNIKGQVVRSLEFTASDVGLTTVWDGMDEERKKVSPGIYFYRIHADNKIVFRKMIVIK